jgi:cytochrome c-type biogenesis protein CcmH
VIRAALVAATAALALASPAAACTKHASQGALETQLVCPSCHTTLDESDSEVAREMKAEIARRIAACQSAKQIRNAMVAEFGPTILSTPQTHGFDLLAWVLPLGGAAAGAVALAFAARAWTRGRAPAGANSAQGGLTPEDERRVDEALARFDG